MLIVTRRAGELIEIGDEIRLCVLEIDGERVRLGISAPRDYPVALIDHSDDSPVLVKQTRPQTDQPHAAGADPRRDGALPAGDDSV
jgi:hypothetical protein